MALHSFFLFSGFNSILGHGFWIANDVTKRKEKCQTGQVDWDTYDWMVRDP